MTIEKAKEYLSRLERNTDKDEKHKQRANKDAGNLSALDSLAEFGNPIIAKKALKVIKGI